MKIGAQIYSLRKDLGDVAGVKKVFDFLQKAGAEVVELAAMPNMETETLVAIAKNTGVKIVSSHSQFKDIKKNIAKLIDEHVKYGAKFIGIGSMPPKYMLSVRRVKKFAAIMNEAQAEAKKHGLTMIYHNHAFEFAKFKNTTIFDILLSEFSTDIQFCLDCYWAYVGKQDVTALIKRLDGRLGLLHCKDYPQGGTLNGYKMCATGVGILDYAAYLKQGELSGAEYALVELDESPDPEKEIIDSVIHLKKTVTKNYIKQNS